VDRAPWSASRAVARCSCHLHSETEEALRSLDGEEVEVEATGSDLQGWRVSARVWCVVSILAHV